MAKRKPREFWTLWLPSAFDTKTPIYWMHTGQRGDMYHLRAAMQLDDRCYSLVLYGCTASGTKDTKEYLRYSVARNKRNSFYVPWSRKELTGTTPSNFENCRLNGEEYDGVDDIKKITVRVYGTYDATKHTAEASEGGGLPDSIPRGMAQLGLKSETYLKKYLEYFPVKDSEGDLRYSDDDIFKKVWDIEPDDAKKSTILVMYRDSGCTANGAYPELDTGRGIATIRQIIEEIPGRKDHGLEVISCGFQDEGKQVGIGHYWTALPSVDKVKENTNGEDVTKRDIEAYFLKWAFQKHFFKMAVGMRSGPFDLFTFLGIPTVSIGLRNMIGEPRHELLAGEGYKRINVQYDVPRHLTTAFVRNNNSKLDPLITSPYWKGEAPSSGATSSQQDPCVPRDPLSEDQNAAEQKKPLKNFSKFDKHVIEVGVRRACQLYVRSSDPLKMVKSGAFPDVITTSFARSCVMSADKEKAQLKELQNIDREDVLTIKMLPLQLPYQLFENLYLQPYVKHWG